METVVAPMDDEREDGEIVDDFEDISDYSIPSCGKSDYSQDILRAISLSSISDSGGEREFGKKHYLPPRKRHRYKGDHHRSKKKRKRGELVYNSRKSRRSLSSSSSTESDTDGDKLDKRMLRQLKEAVRINTSSELHHNSLRTRLKAMIDPESIEEDDDVETLRTLALLTKSEGSPKPIEKLEADDTLNDKELAELRSEALKSAVIKKHMERKKRKELDKKENNNVVQVEVGSNDKENENNEQKDAIEEDVDVMRAMLLASISKRITSTPSKNPVCKPAITSTPNIIPPIKNRTALQNKQTNSKPPLPIKLPSVKPLIIRLNSDSESDFDKSGTNKPEASPIDETVTKLLKMHRDKFEAKEKQSEQKTNVINNNKDPLLDKSVVKLLSTSQQREYQLLKQKLFLANKGKVRKVSTRGARNAKKEAGEEKGSPGTGNLKEALLQEIQFKKDGRLQMKGKYKELAPLIQKVNVASEKRKQCEERIKELLKNLTEARVEHATSHNVFTSLVQKLKQAKEIIDLRLSKMAKVNTNAGIKPTTALKKTTLEPVKPNSAPILPKNKKVESPPEIKNMQAVQNHVIPNGVQSNEAVEANVVESPAKVQEKETNAEVQNGVIPADVCAEVQITNTDAILAPETVQIPVDEAIVENRTKSEAGVKAKYSEYVSPLDRRFVSCQGVGSPGNGRDCFRSQIASNPLQMLCPYELFGTCRDQDCVFKHCP